jgi:hypothetical protein
MTPATGMLSRRPGLQIGDQMHLTSGHRGRNFRLQSSVSNFHYGQQNKGFAAVFACVRTIAVDLCRAGRIGATLPVRPRAIAYGDFLRLDRSAPRSRRRGVCDSPPHQAAERAAARVAGCGGRCSPRRSCSILPSYSLRNNPRSTRIGTTWSTNRSKGRGA